jgi:hypothetical protein
MVVRLKGCDGASETLLAFLLLEVDARDVPGDDALDREEFAPFTAPVAEVPELPFLTAGGFEGLSLPPGAARFLQIRHQCLINIDWKLLIPLLDHVSL